MGIFLARKLLDEKRKGVMLRNFTDLIGSMKLTMTETVKLIVPIKRTAEKIRSVRSNYLLTERK
jgi:hypothetical protein